MKRGRKPHETPRCWLCKVPIDRELKKRTGGTCLSCNSVRVMVSNIITIGPVRAEERLAKLKESARLYQFVLDRQDTMTKGEITKEYVKENKK